MVNFNGKNDLSVGWAEKLGFFNAIQNYALGGIEYWDNRDHAGSEIPSAFASMLDLHYLYRFRSNLSWPAFSHCSSDGNPGDGTAVSGDSLGTINGYLDWDPALTDSAGTWQVRLMTRSLTTLWGPLPAPESLIVHVTPRRTQRFASSPGSQVTWNAVRLSDGATVQTGTVTADEIGLVTIPGVNVYRTGTRLTLHVAVALAVPPSGPHPGAPVFAPFANPARGRTALAVTWSRAGHARVELFDTSGRRMRVLLDGDVVAGEWRASADLSGLAPGVYLARAEQAGTQAFRRVVLLR